MSGRPQVSVAMAAYNGEAFIEAQIASILPQLEEGDELVISLDPSKDRTAEIIEGFADSRIRLLPGLGEGVQKNFENALRHCGGEILFLCDQDDVWAPDKVESVLSVFAARDALLVLHDAQIADGALHVTEPSFFAAHVYHWHPHRLLAQCAAQFLYRLLYGLSPRTFKERLALSRSAADA